MQKIYKIILNLKSKHRSNIVFDTRILKKNDIFIALKTEKNDGNSMGKIAIRVTYSVPQIDNKLRAIEVLLYAAG